MKISLFYTQKKTHFFVENNFIFIFNENWWGFKKKIISPKMKIHKHTHTHIYNYIYLDNDDDDGNWKCRK